MYLCIRVCSTAAFGKTAPSASTVTHLLSDIVQAHDRFGCKSAKPLRDDEYMPYSGKIVVIERGGCTFEEKTVNAQDGGAVGVIIINTDVSYSKSC
jgi:hypothetical protein